jgi:hypothetical protein
MTPHLASCASLEVPSLHAAGGAVESRARPHWIGGAAIGCSRRFFVAPVMGYWHWALTKSELGYRRACEMPALLPLFSTMEVLRYQTRRRYR